MALADTARLVASLELQDKFSRTADKFDSRLGGMNRHLQTFGRNLQIGAAAGIGFLSVSVAQGIQSLQRLEEVTTATEAVIESTGGTAGITAERVRELAEEYESLNATMDDKVIQSAENLLLTFTNIREDAFEPALEAALNMNQALGGGEEGLQSTVIQLGKALQDPIRGITALRRVGVNFSTQQQQQIRDLVEQNRLFEAQQIILQELETEFGGQFAAAGTTATANFAKFKDAIEDSQMALATAFLPVLEKVSTKLTELLADPATQAAIRDFGTEMAEGFDALVELAGNLPWEAIGNAFELMGTGAKALLTAFTSLPPWVQTAVLTGWGLNKLTGGALTSIAGALASGLVKGVLGINAGVVNINAGTVNGAPAAGGGAGGLAARIVGTAAIGGAVTGGVIGVNRLLGASTPDEFQSAAFDLSGGFSGLIATAIEEVIGDPLGDLLGAENTSSQDRDRFEQDALRRLNEQNAIADQAKRAQATFAQQQLARLAAIERKDFKPTVKVTTNVTSNVAITDITRRLVSQRIATSGTGGFTVE